MWRRDKRRRRSAVRRSRRTRRRDYATTARKIGGASRPRPRPRLPVTARWLSLVLLITVGVLGWYLLTNPQFRVQGSAVEGNRLLSAEAIYQAAGVHGANIFYVNTTEAAERLRQIPLVRDARVSVQFPNRVRIQVMERQPVVTWVSGGIQAAVDEDGVILPAQAVNPEAVVIEVQAGGPAQPGLQVDERAIAVARELHELRPDMGRFLLSADRGVAIVTPQGWPVYFGWETTDLSHKVAVLERVTPVLLREGTAVEFIDLRFPTRPYYHVATP